MKFIILKWSPTTGHRQVFGHKSLQTEEEARAFLSDVRRDNPNGIYRVAHILD